MLGIGEPRLPHPDGGLRLASDSRPNEVALAAHDAHIGGDAKVIPDERESLGLGSGLHDTNGIPIAVDDENDSKGEHFWCLLGSGGLSL